MATMFTIHYGLACIFLLYCCYKSEVIVEFRSLDWRNVHDTKSLTLLKNRTCVALAKETVQLHFQVNVPANSSESHFFCYLNRQKELKYQKALDKNPTHAVNTENVFVNLIMHNSSDSGEYYCQYMMETIYFVILVRDVGYQPEEVIEEFVTILLVVSGLLLFFGIAGSIYIYKWHKDRLTDDSSKEKRKMNADVQAEEAITESVYTALEPRQASVYDVLNVDKKEGTDKWNSKEKGKTSPAEEGIFESVYENY